MSRTCWSTLLLVAVFGCGPSGRQGPNDCTDPSSCPDNVSCPAGVMRCGPNRSVQQCNTMGTAWTPVAHCASNQSCGTGQCSPAACMGMSTQCTGDGRIQTCLPQNGQFSDPQPCPVGQACVGTSCIPTVCTPNQRFCRDSMTVAQCSALGDNSTVIMNCTGNSTCANGDCLNACQAADLLKSFAGCVFYAVDMDNDSSNDRLENDIIVANQSNFTANVKIEVRQGASNWTSVCSAAIPSQMTHPFALTSTCDFTSSSYLDRHVEDSALVTGMAYRVTSDAPVVAYYFNSDDKSGSASSSGSTVLLPKATLGKKYYAVSWPQPAAPGFGDTNRSGVDIVGTQDGTTVVVHSSTHIIAGAGVPMMGPGDVQNFMLNEGDVLQLETLMAGDDVTGTYIDADKPVAVFGGSECLSNPNGGADCDHIEEQILPLIAWGKNYIAPRVVGQSTNCNGTGPGGPEVNCPPSIYRIVGSVANTTVTVMAPPGVTLTPPGPTFMLGPGMVQDITARGSSTGGVTAPGDFFITADQAILVMELTGSETAMVTVVPYEQFLQRYQFGVPDFFCTTITVTRKAGTVVQLDGTPIASSLFTPAGGGYEVAHFPIPQPNGCGVGSSQGNVASHVVTSLPTPEGRNFPAGIDLYGVDINCSYGYVGGLNITVINPVE